MSATNEDGDETSILVSRETYATEKSKSFFPEFEGSGVHKTQ